MLCRLDERGLFRVKGGKASGRTTIVGLDPEMAEPGEREWGPGEKDKTCGAVFIREVMTEALPRLASAEEGDLPLLLAEYDLLPIEVAEVLRNPDWPPHVRHNVVKQEQCLAAELGYLVRRALDAG